MKDERLVSKMEGKTIFYDLTDLDPLFYDRSAPLLPHPKLSICLSASHMLIASAEKGGYVFVFVCMFVCLLAG